MKLKVIPLFSFLFLVAKCSNTSIVDQFLNNITSNHPDWSENTICILDCRTTGSRGLLKYRFVKYPFGYTLRSKIVELVRRKSDLLYDVEIE